MIRALVAAAALIALTACGGEGDEPSTATSTEPAAVALVDACGDVQAALDEHLEGTGPIAPAENYRALSDDLAPIAAKLDERGSADLGALVEASNSLAEALETGADAFDPEGAWNDAARSVLTTCEGAS